MKVNPSLLGKVTMPLPELAKVSERFGADSGAGDVVKEKVRGEVGVLSGRERAEKSGAEGREEGRVEGRFERALDEARGRQKLRDEGSVLRGKKGKAEGAERLGGGNKKEIKKGEGAKVAEDGLEGAEVRDSQVDRTKGQEVGKMEQAGKEEAEKTTATATVSQETKVDGTSNQQQEGQEVEWGVGGVVLESSEGEGKFQSQMAGVGGVYGLNGAGVQQGQSESATTAEVVGLVHGSKTEIGIEGHGAKGSKAGAWGMNGLGDEELRSDAQGTQTAGDGAMVGKVMVKKVGDGADGAGMGLQAEGDVEGEMNKGHQAGEGEGNKLWNVVAGNGLVSGWSKSDGGGVKEGAVVEGVSGVGQAGAVVGAVGADGGNGVAGMMGGRKGDSMGSGVGGGVEGQAGNEVGGAEGGVGEEGSDVQVNIGRVARGLQTALAQRGGTVTLRLHPPELGILRVQMQVQDNLVSAKFMVEHEGARSVLTQGMENLRSSLEKQGLVVDRLEVQMQTANSGAMQGGGGQQARADVADDGRSQGRFMGGQSSGGSSQEGSGEGREELERRGRSFAEQLVNMVA